MLGKKLIKAAAGNAGAEADENFNQTVLLLHGDGSNGAQNNTFLDSSTNNFTITRNGDATQGTFSPFSKPDGRWSIDSQRAAATQIAIADDASLRIGTNEFAIEAMVYMRDFDEISVILSKTQGGMAAGDWSFEFNTSGQLRFGYSTSYLTYGTALNLNQWYHLAVTRNASNLVEIWVDGVSVTSATISTDLDSTDNVKIAENSGGDREANFIISNLRFVNGSSYTPTVPTTPLTAITNTVLLTAQSNRFIDNSTYGHTLSIAGSVSISAYSPFAPIAAYDSAVNGGSAYFDNSGDFLSVANDPALLLGTDAFTIQAWIYLESISGQNIIISKGNSSATGTWQLQTLGTSGLIRWRWNSAAVVDSTIAVKPYEWSHIVVVREGTGTNEFKIYVNGVQDTFTTVNQDFDDTGLLKIGRNRDSDTNFPGYISGLSIVRSAIWTSDFTPPTSPPTAITGTELLCNFTNAGIFDNTGKNNLETLNNAQVDTTIKKFGTGAMEFAGSGDRLLVPDQPYLRLGLAPFTIEAWVYLNAAVATNEPIVAKGDAGGAGTWQFDIQPGNTVQFDTGSYTVNSTGSITLNEWYHLAVVREGTGTNETKIYINGVNDGTGTVAEDLNIDTVLKIGRNRGDSTNYNGFIDDLRITNGVARYLTSFTPPTKAFLDQ